MFDILLNAVLFLLNAILIWPVLRYNAHMLQQNTYRNTEQMVWLKINYHKQRSIWGRGPHYPVFRDHYKQNRKEFRQAKGLPL